MGSKRKNERNRKYLLTINNPEEKGITPETIIEQAKKYACRYFCFCAETGSQGVYHWHIFICYVNAINFSTIKSLFPSAHIDAVLGTSKQNRAYILKSAPEHNKKSDGSYEYKDSSGKVHKGINHEATFYEFGECPDEHQGRRSDLEYMYSLVKDGHTDSEILDLCGETAIKHVDKIAKLRHTYLVDKFKEERRLNLKVHYITGKTGTGKSRDILDEYGDRNVYRVTDYEHPFDSYIFEHVLVLEEYRSSLRLSDALNYLDIYPCILPARYSPKVACYDTVYVVSNWEFEQQYADIQREPERKTDYEAWIRRFNGFVKEYYDVGKYKQYNSMQEYLHRHEEFYSIPEGTKIPFDEEEKYDQEELPFD
jgi:Putative viral replication protein.